jgi:hypothetical protein
MAGHGDRQREAADVRLDRRRSGWREGDTLKEIGSAEDGIGAEGLWDHRGAGRRGGAGGRTDARMREEKRRTIFHLKLILFSSRDRDRDF